MTDPFRGEMTAKYVQRERLEWAARERLARQAKPIAEGKKRHFLGLETYLTGLLTGLLQGHRRPHALPRARMAH